MERLREAVRELALPHQGRRGESFTVSAGVTTAGDGTQVPSQALLARADAALFLAKHSGRDRTCRHGAPAVPARS